jgi:hypothetical protein
MTLIRFVLAAALGAAIVIGTAIGILNPWLVALVAGGGAIVLLPRQPRLVGVAVVGAAATMLSWSILWTVSWQSM